MTDTPAPVIDDLMFELLELMENSETPEAITTTLATLKDRVRTLSEVCKQTKLYQRSSDQVDVFKADIDASVVPEERLAHAWLWLLDRISEAPTGIHMRSSIRLCLPLVACYLPE